MFAPASRRVRRLHLRADADDDAARAATLLTDALHTASLPSDHGRLVVIQRLALGRISTHASPAALALHIERVTREALSAAVVYDLPAASRANAVVFPDRSEAIVALAALHARNEPTDQWFWTAIVPAWQECVTPDARWTELLEAAHALPEGAVTAAAVVDRAIRASAEERLLSSLRSSHAARWLRGAGWDRPDTQPVSVSPVTLDDRHTAAVERWLRVWGARDDRTIWLGTMCAVVEQPARVADSRLPSRVAHLLRERFERTHGLHPSLPAPLPRRSAPAPGPAREHEAEGEARMGPPARADVSRSTSDTTSVEDARGAKVAAADVGEEQAPDDRAPSRGSQANAVARLFTPYAGLLLVIPVLERLAFGRFLVARPALLETDFPVRLLRRIGHFAGLTKTDPLAQMFERAGLPEVGPRSDDEWLLDAWTIAVRRWCRRNLRVPLATVICRPGRVHLSRTHMESFFDLSQLDVRLRRVALDVDPGWVPWFGRVVRFHYGAIHDSSR